jgi:hypothetical protein
MNMTAHSGRGDLDACDRPDCHRIWPADHPGRRRRAVCLTARRVPQPASYVPFVLWFNFLAGFAYVIAGVGLWMRRRWAAWMAVAIAVATALVFLAFGVHVALGGAWERRTVIAMTLRTLVWVGIAAMAWRRSTANAPATREH